MESPFQVWPLLLQRRWGRSDFCCRLGVIYKNLSKNYLEASILGLKEELSKARQKTQGVIGVNIMVALSNFADLVRTAIAEKADIIFAGAGMPLNLPSFLQKDSTTKLVPIVSSGRAAKLICEKWKSIYNYLPDALVVEGPKAGGHLGFKNEQIDDEHYQLETILPEVIQEAHEIEEKYGRKIPVIAAGGIYSGDDIRKIMELGADGVQMGTRFVTTEECDASDVFKQTYLNAHEEDIQIIRSPVGCREGRFSVILSKRSKRGKNNRKCALSIVLKPVISVRVRIVSLRPCTTLSGEIWKMVMPLPEPMHSRLRKLCL